MRKKNNTITISHLILVVLILSFCAIIYKLSYVSLANEIDGINLTKFVEARNTETDVLPATRGCIYSGDNELLAKNINSYNVIAFLDPKRTENSKNPRHVIDVSYTATVLSPILNMEIETLTRLMSQKKYQVELGPGGRGISEMTKKEIEKLNLPGIGFTSSSKRYYLLGSLAPYIIGYASTDDDGTISGKMGIESYFDKELEGQDGYTIYQKDLYGYTMPNTTTVTVPAQPGKDVYLTIDSKIQMFLENGIKEISEANDMTWLTFSVMDAKTGAIVASASNPTFNLNERVITNYLNPLTSYAYEPGSTMKIFSFLAAMENGSYNGSDTYPSGKIEVEDAVIQDFNGGVGWGTITYDEGFAYSSNVAATRLALKIGRDKLHDFYDNLGFGSKTNITLPGEVKGSANFIYRTELATAAFGQGITTTPIQNLQALSILTNNGMEIQPYIVEKIVDSNTGEVTYQHQRKELGQKVTKENAEKMRALMYDVVYSGKTDARYYKSDTITMIGKTGTAQITGASGGYLTGKTDYVRSFAGIFPYDNPQYIIYVSVKQYSGIYKDFASMVTNVVEEIAKYKNITDNTTKIDNSKIIKMENYISKNTQESIEQLQNQGMNVVTIGNGKYIINQYPKKDKKIPAGSKAILITNGELTMPNVIGFSSNEVITICKLLNLNYNINGVGNVVSTSIPEGTPITKDMTIAINLSY